MMLAWYLSPNKIFLIGLILFFLFSLFNAILDSTRNNSFHDTNFIQTGLRKKKKMNEYLTLTEKRGGGKRPAYEPAYIC